MKRLFLTHPITGADATLLELVTKLGNSLTEEGFDVTSARDAYLPQGDSLTEVRSIISRSDFTIAVLGDKLSVGLVFEIGYTIGLGKDVLIVAPLDLNLSTFLEEVPCILHQEEPELTSALVVSYLKKVKEQKRQLTEHPSRADDQRLAQYQIDVSELFDFTSPREFEQRAIEVLLNEGFKLVEAPQKDTGFDFAVKAPDSNDLILIEVKMLVKQSRVSVDTVRALLSL